MEIAALNKQKTVVRVGQTQYNLQCKQPHILSVFYFKMKNTVTRKTVDYCCNSEEDRKKQVTILIVCLLRAK